MGHLVYLSTKELWVIGNESLLHEVKSLFTPNPNKKPHAKPQKESATKIVAYRNGAFVCLQLLYLLKSTECR